MMNLTLENLRTTERILKNAYRAVRAASNSASGGIEPDSTKFLDRQSPVPFPLDITTIRIILSLANHPQGAAALVAYFMDDYVE